MSEKLVLIDGHSILNRAFFGIPDLTNSEGLHTNAVYGFLNILFKILEEEQPNYLTVAFDVSQPTFRHKMYAEYKGTRKPMAEELREQVPLMKEMFAFIRDYRGDVPGASARDCGNYLDMNLPMANWLADRFLREVLDSVDDSRLLYPED